MFCSKKKKKDSVSVDRQMLAFELWETGSREGARHTDGPKGSTGLRKGS